MRLCAAPAALVQGHAEAAAMAAAVHKCFRRLCRTRPSSYAGVPTICKPLHSFNVIEITMTHVSKSTSAGCLSASQAKSPKTVLQNYHFLTVFAMHKQMHMHIMSFHLSQVGRHPGCLPCAESYLQGKSFSCASKCRNLAVTLCLFADCTGE